MNQPIPSAIHTGLRVILVAAIVGYGLLALAVVEMAIRGGVPRVAFDGTASFRGERVLNGNLTLTGMGAEVHLGAMSVSAGNELAVRGRGRLWIGDSYRAYGSAKVEGDLLAGQLRVGGSLDIDPCDGICFPGRHRMTRDGAGLRMLGGLPNAHHRLTSRGDGRLDGETKRPESGVGSGHLTRFPASAARKDPSSQPVLDL